MKKIQIHIILILFMGLFLPPGLNAQKFNKPVYLEKLQVKFDPPIKLSTGRITKKYTNRIYSNQLIQEVREDLRKYLEANGYYFLKIDSIASRVDEERQRANIIFYVEPGLPLMIKSITLVNVKELSPREKEDLAEITSNYEGELYNGILVHDLYKSLMTYYENNGFPLAKIKTDGFTFEEPDKSVLFINLKIKIEKGDSIKIAYLRFPNNTSKTDPYLRRILRFKPDMPYDQNHIDRYLKILRREEFIKSVSEPVLIRDAEGNYFLDINYIEAPSASLDGIVGYIPPQANPPNDKGYFTGLVNVGIRNLFGTGRKLQVFWQKQDRFSDEFRIGYREPYTFGLPFHTLFGLNRLLRDTTYIEWKYALKFDFPFTETLSAFVQLTSREVSPDSLASRQLRLPRTTSFYSATGIDWDLRDAALNPRKGLKLQISFSFGQQKNNGPEYLIVEDSLSRKTDVTRVMTDFKFFIPTFKNQVFANSIHGEMIAFSDDNVRAPDMIWFGGATTLRGFREAQFFGDKVIWINTEYRFLLGPLTRFFAFVDNGWYSREFPDKRDDFLTGYGLGLRLSSSLGIMQVDFGLEKGAPFREGKLHFRLINEF